MGIVVGRYVLGARIGDDAISEFYVARHTGLDAPATFVLRLMTAQAAQDPAQGTAFRAAALAMLETPVPDVRSTDFDVVTLDGIERNYMVFRVGDNGGSLLATLGIGAATSSASTTIDGRYRLGARIAQDEVSELYVARHTQIVTKEFVVRIATAAAAQRPEVVRAFQDLARKLSKERRTGVDLEDFGMTDKRPYMVFQAKPDGSDLVALLAALMT